MKSRKIAYTLSIMLGVTSIFGGMNFHLPGIGNVQEVKAAEVVVTNETELSNALKTNGTVKLANDIICSNNISLDNVDVTLNLNGKTLTGKNQTTGAISIKSGSFILDGEGTFKGGISIRNSNTSLTMRSGTIGWSKYEGVHAYEGATFNMFGGLITNNNWDGVALDSGSKMNMYGGNITNSDISDIYVSNGSSLMMSGGTINSLSLASSLAVEPAKFSIKGSPVIKKNLSLGLSSGENRLIEVIGNLESGCSINLTAKKNIDFTKNIKVYNGSANPNNFFKAADYGFNLNSQTGEVQMVDKSSSMPASPTTNSVTPTSTPSNTSSSYTPSYYSYSSSDDDDDDDKDSKSFSDGGTKTKGKGATKADYKKSGKTVRYVSAQISYKSSAAKVPATLKVGKKTYKVTAIADLAFSSLDKLKSVTVGKNINKIYPEAFSDCKNLKTLLIHSKKLKAKKVKGCFKGSNIRTVYVPKNKVKAYKKVFTKKNTGNKGRIKVKALK